MVHHQVGMHMTQFCQIELWQSMTQSAQATMEIALPPLPWPLLPFFSCCRFPSSHHWITSQAPLPMIPSLPVTLTWWMSRPFKVHSTIPPYPSWVPSSNSICHRGQPRHSRSCSWHGVAGSAPLSPHIERSLTPSPHHGQHHSLTPSPSCR